MEKGARQVWSRIQLMLPQQYHGVAHEKQRGSEVELAATTHSRPVLGFSSEIENTNLTSLEPSKRTTTEPARDDTQPQDRDWIAGVYLCAKATAGLLLLNVIFIAVMAGLARNHPTAVQFSGFQVFYEGSCTSTSRWSTALHLIINVLGTGILAASNYCMQSLVAPSREEIDSCHGKRKWLDIGTASIRNLFVVGKHRFALWLILLITATPFHLLYNSMVFDSVGTNEYGMFLGPGDLSSGNVLNLTTPALEQCFYLPTSDNLGGMTWTEFSSEIAEGTYRKLSLMECDDFLAQKNAAGTKAIMVLTKELSVTQGGDEVILSASSSVGGLPKVGFGTNGVQAAYGWPFVDTTNNTTNDIQTRKCKAPEDFSQQKVFTGQECLAIPTKERCQLLYSPPIGIIISLCILAKVVAMFLAARVSRIRPAPILTIGDAVASFVAKSDQTTKDMCWMSKKDVYHGLWKRYSRVESLSMTSSERLGDSSPNAAAEYRTLARPTRLLKVPSKKLWAATLFVWLALIGLGAWLIQTLASLDYMGRGQRVLTVDRLRSWGSEGFGSSDYNLGGFISFTMLGSVVVANIPQLILTLSYYCFNNVMTSMLAAAEYDSYAIQYKPLRVTRPVKNSQQRSTYWLSVPYKYAVPILVIYMVLHWLVSQSIFYVLIIPYATRGEEDWDQRVSCLAFSPLLIFCSILVGSFMICLLIMLAFKRLNSAIPLAGACSAAISAACHPPKDEDPDTIALGPIKWGETMELSSDVIDGFQHDVDAGKGHCSFTSLDTVKPKLEKLYA